MTAPQSVAISINSKTSVSGLWLCPKGARACLVLAHSAGAGMGHASMAVLASGLATRTIATLRFQFPYMEQGRNRPDPPAVAHQTVRAAVAEASRLSKELPLFAGGRSFGGRMTSQAQAILPLVDVQGLVLFAFPLHPAGKPSIERARHLFDVSIPSLFLQGTRDGLAEIDLLQPVIADLGGRARLHLINDADHAFHVPARSGRADADVLAEILDVAAAWMTAPERQAVRQGST